MSNWNRRAFLSQLSLTAGALMLPASVLTGIRKASGGASGTRRHLVNMVGAGGWDTSWFHNAFSQKAIQGLPEASISLSKGGFELTGFDLAKLLYTQKCSDASETEMKPHPMDPRHMMGPGMGLVFDPADYNDFLIWKGLIPAGGHGFGNNLIMHGNTSSYAVSFSGLIAQALDEERRRPLHYTLMADNPAALFTNAAMQSGPSVPICIASVDQFKNMTQFDPKDFSKKELRDVIAQSISGLTTAALGGSAQLKDTKSRVDSYLASFNGANFIYGSNFADSIEFKYLHKRYILAMAQTYLNASRDPNMMSRFATLPALSASYSWGDMFNTLGGLVAKLAPLPKWDDFTRSPSTYEASILDIYGDRYALLGGTYASFYSSYAQFDRMVLQAYAYAFADYLVRFDLSAVVDIPAWPGLMDAHGNHMLELSSLLQTFSCFREMIRSFKEVPLPNQGGTLFDATLLALHSEFDRENWHQPRFWASPDAPVNSGTDHGQTASLLLAGYGIQRGRVIGGMHQGPRIHGSYPGRYTQPLPIDVSSGDIVASGRTISTLAVMPTIMGIFGAQIPAQQISDWSAISAVIKRS